MRFVVGYVPDRRGSEAVALGATLAGGREIGLDVVVVMPSDDPTYDMYSPDRRFQAALTDQAQEWLDGGLAQVPSGVPAQGRVRHDDSITQGLIEAATDPDLGPEAEAIIVGASHRGLIGELLIGSVSGALLHSSPVPVAIAPSGYAGHPALTRITVALGEGKGADALFDVAVAAAAARGIPLRLMSLIALDQEDESREARLAAAREHADELVEQARAQLPAECVVTGEVGTGRALEDCVTAMEFEESEIVMLGSGRLARKRRVFLSASAHRIVRALPVPMVVVPRDYELPVLA